LLLTYLLAARERGVAPQLVALSAVIGDINDFDAWLGCEKLVTHERPVRLVEGVLDRSGVYQFLDEQGRSQTTQLLPAGAVRMRRDEPSAQDVIVPLVRMLVERGEKVIVFRNMRGSASGCAAYLAAELGLPSAEDVLTSLPTRDLSTMSATLRRALAGGAALHTSDLSREERVAVERAFRDPDGAVRVLAATTTVAAGINTPASTVILAEQEFLGEDGRPFTVAEYKNLAGRAGRLGFREDGRSIILAEAAVQRAELFRRYVRGSPEALRSSFDPQHFSTWVVRLLAQVTWAPRGDVARLLANTYGGYLAARAQPGWREDAERRVEALLERMLRLELLETAERDDGQYVQLTLLGRACGRSGLAFESAMRLVELLRRLRPEDLTPERLMAILQILPESDGGYTPVMRRGRAESVRP
jgi:replicative superfamily II helicase